GPGAVPRRVRSARLPRSASGSRAHRTVLAAARRRQARATRRAAVVPWQQFPVAALRRARRCLRRGAYSRSDPGYHGRCPDPRSYMSAEVLPLSGWIGRSETASDLATEFPCAALAATLECEAPAPRAGEELPPLWHWLYFLPVHRMSELAPDGHAH